MSKLSEICSENKEHLIVNPNEVILQAFKERMDKCLIRDKKALDLHFSTITPTFKKFKKIGKQ